MWDRIFIILIFSFDKNFFLIYFWDSSEIHFEFDPRIQFSDVNGNVFEITDNVISLQEDAPIGTSEVLVSFKNYPAGEHFFTSKPKEGNSSVN